MARVEPIRREDVPDLEDIFSRAEQALGFVPNSFFAMGRSPGILRAFTRLAREVIGVPGKAPLPLKRMAGYMASRSAGCMYCSSHTAETASVVDGVVAAGASAVEEPTLTGESAPVEKAEGSQVFAGTINITSFMTVRASTRSDESAVSRLAHISVVSRLARTAASVVCAAIAAQPASETAFALSLIHI